MNEAEVKKLVLEQREFFKSGKTRSYSFRRSQLVALKEAIKKNEEEILEAVYKDLKKPVFEAYSSEILTLYNDLSFTLNNLKSWMKVERLSTSLIHWPSSTRIIKEPVGNVLIISPWNYPFLLALSPLISAIAAGNCSIIKPSEYSIHTSELLTKLVKDIFDPGFVHVINGDGHILGPQLIEKHHFDHILFTGSPAVGKEIMRMASQQLSPVTLELGGKSPAIVEKDANIKVSAKRIAWGKFWNAGQTCIAPDYVLVHEDIKDEFIEALKNSVLEFYGKDAEKGKNFGRIISKKHFKDLIPLLGKGKIEIGGSSDENDLYIEPTILTDVSLDDEVMQREIFGPILPVITFKSQDEVIQIVEHNPYPLSCYIFSESQKKKDFYVESIRFGGGGINIPLIHFSHPELPLEGVGNSGIGNYRGKYGFDTFTHRKSIMSMPTWPDIPLKYPPFMKLNGLIKRFLKF